MALYLRLALVGMRKNGRIYLPYLIACTGMSAMFYIMAFLPYSDFMNGWHGEETLRVILMLGIWVIAFFAIIFLFYTHSFLIRRRKREFGLYHVLGMGKGNIARVLVWETFFSAVLSIGAGLLLGIAFSRLAELGLARIVTGVVKEGFSIPYRAVVMTVILFGGIHLLILLVSFFQVRISGTTELLRSENQGEKPPKANWVLGLAGILLLGGAYWMAVTIENPLSAVTLFFVAVLMVIVGTYLVFISGSVLFCRLLQKNRRYYYQKNHFVSVSSMAYRMKRNGAGLASICILGTMVLVMIAGSACLYFGAESTLHARYPRAINMDVAVNCDYDFSSLRSAYEAVTASVEKTEVLDYRYTVLSGVLRDGIFEPDRNQVTGVGTSLYSGLVDLCLLDGADGTLFAGNQYAPREGEVLLYTVRTKYDRDSITFGGNTYRVAGTLDSLALTGEATANIVPSVFVVVPDFEKTINAMIRDSESRWKGRLSWYYGFDMDAPLETQRAVMNAMSDAFMQEFENTTGIVQGIDFECREQERSDYYSLYGGIYFLGILLSVVFLCAAVLIIYYKQVSEGYEDAGRFGIMQKVGMTKRDIRRNVNSQMLTVFLLPLLLSVLHLAFAFPMIRQLLLMFGINNLPLLLLTAGVSVLIFGLFYALVYRITAGAYYRIISDSAEA